VRRIGQVINLRPDRIDEYEHLHAAVWPGVLQAIHRANIRNYTIYRHGTQLFATYEYVGEAYETDMAAMAVDTVVREWWVLTDAMQEPLPDREPGAWWTTIAEIFHTD
jgi:L-rhamnose mutarotase